LRLLYGNSCNSTQKHELTSLLHRQWIQQKTQKSLCVSWACYTVIWHKYIRWRCHAIDDRYDQINKNHRAFVEFVITVIWHKCVRWRCHPIVQTASKTKKLSVGRGFVVVWCDLLLHSFVDYCTHLSGQFWVSHFCEHKRLHLESCKQRAIIKAIFTSLEDLVEHNRGGVLLGCVVLQSVLQSKLQFAVCCKCVR